MVNLNQVTSLPFELLDRLDQLPQIHSIAELIKITGSQTLEHGYLNPSQQPTFVEEPSSGGIILLDNEERTLVYALKNEEQFFDPQAKHFKATGDKSMLGFRSSEYTGQLNGSRFITAINYRPFHHQSGILIPKPKLIEGFPVECSMRWSEVSEADLSYLQFMSQNGVSIWNAMSAPSSPYLHFQFISNFIPTRSGVARLPLSQALSENAYNSTGVVFEDLHMNCIVSDDCRQTLSILNRFELNGVYCDLLISEGRFLLIPKREDKYIIKYPWGVYWKPTAERLGFIFYHHEMSSFIEGGTLISNFWHTNNSQVLAES